LLVRNFSISLDGYAAGPHQYLDNPLGVGGGQLHEWIFATRSGAQMVGNDGGSEGLDDEFFSNRESGVGATIMGRNMFGPIRGGARVSGPDGGERILLFVTRSSCSLTNRMLLSKCKGEQASISSTAGSKKLSEQPPKWQVTVMS
jgi:dihydrofolate reductase